MKSSTYALKSFLLLAYFSMIQVVLFAQDEGSTTTTSSSKTEITVKDTTASDWYTSPWVWIIGAALFILLLVALLSNRGTDRSDRVVVKKTVVDRDRDRDPDVV